MTFTRSNDFDEPWDGPNNSKLHNVIMSCLPLPVRETRRDGDPTPATLLSWLARARCFRTASLLNFSDIRDGESSTNNDRRGRQLDHSLDGTARSAHHEDGSNHQSARRTGYLQQPRGAA